MSVQAISWALSIKAGSPAAKCVLICLANYADENGVCWPSQALLAEQTEQSLDTVQRRLAELTEDGLIGRKRRQNKAGGRATDVYQLCLEVKPQTAAKGLSRKSDGLSRTVAVYKDEPSLRTVKESYINSEEVKTLSSVDSLSLEEVSEERSTRQELFEIEVDDDWPKDCEEQFWSACPRKIGRIAAMKKLAVVKRSGVEFSTVIDGMRRYARSVASTEMQFIVHPATWLNQGRWSDEEKSLDRIETQNGKVSNPYALMARRELI